MPSLSTSDSSQARPADGSSTLKVCLVNGAGQPDYAFSLAKGIAENGWRVSVLGKALESQPALPPYVDWITCLNACASPGLLSKALRSGRYHLAVRRHIHRIRPQIVHVQWLVRPYVLGAMWIILTTRLLGLTSVVTVHNVSRRKRDGGRSRVEEFLARAYYRAFHAVVVHTFAAESELISEYGLSSQRVQIVGMSLNYLVPRQGIGQGAARADLDLPPDARVLLCFGRIEPYKGIDLIIPALKRLSDSTHPYVLVVAGPADRDGQYLSSLRQLATQCGVADRTLIHSVFVPFPRVETYFSAADLVLLPYRAVYQSGVLFLALTFGVPVLASRLAGFEEIVDSDIGAVYANGSPETTARAVRNLLANPIPRAAVRRQAKKRFSSRIIGRRTTILYERLISQA